MTLSPQLAVSKNEVLYQEDVTCLVTLKNTGSSPISMGFPSVDSSMPIIHVLDLSAGGDRKYSRPEESQKGFFPDFVLSPGTELEESVSLWNIVPQQHPGEYDIRVGWAYSDTEYATSNSVRVKVLPSTPAGLNTVNAEGGYGALKYGVWVDMANRPFMIMRGAFYLTPGLPIGDVQPITQCSPDCKPMLSAPASGVSLGSHWIAWVEEGMLKIVHAHKNLGVSGEMQLTLPTSDIQIVAPLYSDPPADTRTRPDGAMLLFKKLPGYEQFALYPVEFTTQTVKAESPVTLPGNQPLWITSHARSQNDRLVSYIQSEGEIFTLSSAPWPKPGSGSVGIKQLSQWKGRFLSAHAVVGRDGAVFGGLLFITDSEEGPKVLLTAWTLLPSGEFKMTTEHDMEWHPSEQISQTKVAVNDNGLTAALLCDGQEKWHIYDGNGAIHPVPAEFEKTKQPIEIAFLGGDEEPLLICGTVALGFRVSRLDGSPLPPIPPK
ncbi:MAG: hypothetical protein JRG75_04450 [Deltaproteobacteria bacterium]|nr:hypothetical protein [Deltaproteobacteria bacterium]